MYLAQQELHLDRRRAAIAEGKLSSTTACSRPSPRTRRRAERQPEGDAAARPPDDDHRPARGRRSAFSSLLRRRPRRRRSSDSDDKLTRAFLSLPVEPGTHFRYNTPATYMLSAMVQKATGQTVLDYLRPRLFDPLGITDATWDASKQGITLGGFGLRIKTEDIARFGQLYLQKGEWQGKQLCRPIGSPPATARQTSNGSSPTSDWEQGYGYQFWRCRHGFYRGDGAFGQFCIVMPEQDAVVAITSGTRDMQAVLDKVWEHLLPAMGPDALPATDAYGESLRQARLCRCRCRGAADVAQGGAVVGESVRAWSVTS